MAIHPKIKFLHKLPKLTYPEVRPQLETGDAYFQIDHGFGPWWIALQARLDGFHTAFTHVGMFRWDDSYLMGMEAVFPLSGQFRFSSIAERHKQATIVICKLNTAAKTRKGILNSARTYIGNRYNLAGVKKFAEREIKELLDLRVYEKADKFGTGNKQLFCSQFYALCLAENGILLSAIPPSKISPTQLFFDGVQNGHLTPLGILKPSKDL